ncbi:MAG: hypothetical protein H8D45_00355 [Bacteroidetes bacterium]|nr:hypothetical protein [Bacteroidota bacterium]
MKLNISDIFGNRRFIIYIVLFLFFLLYFFLTSYWHIPSQLIIKGNVQSGTGAAFTWDSGEGYNNMESANVVLGNYVSPDKKKHVIRIRRTGKKNSFATSSEVRIREISVGDAALDLGDFRPQKNVKLINRRHLYLEKDEAEIKFQVAAVKKMDFIFGVGPSMGYVEVVIDGDAREYDLYSTKGGLKTIFRTTDKFIPGDFNAAISLPRYDIKRFKLETLEAFNKFTLYSVSINSRNGDLNIPVEKGKYISEIHFKNIKRNTKKYFHPIRFGFQIVLAALCTYLTTWLFLRIRAFGGIKSTFLGDKRYVFWLMFFGAVFAFSTWLLAYWPGYMTSDSIHIWWAAKKPGYFIHSHPFMNVIYYRFLQQIWDNIAVVSVFQILLTSLLGSYIFYYLYKNGVNKFLILPFYFAFISSIPVGLYNISLWKDIPFAFLVLFLAYYIVRLKLKKNRSILKISDKEIILLLLLVIAICLFRYNGIVYIIIIPIALALLKFISFKRVLAFFAVLFLIGITNIGIMKLYDKEDFFFHRAGFFIKRLKNEPISKTALRIVKQYPTVLDINTYKHSDVWYDIWHRDDEFVRWHYDFARKIGYNDFFKYQQFNPKSVKLYNLLNSITHHSYREPIVYFSWNPYYMLYIFPVFFLYMFFPLAAVYGFVIFTQVFVLLWILGPYNYNWRYYYFLLFSLYFFIPIVALDIKTKHLRTKKTMEKNSVVMP